MRNRRRADLGCLENVGEILGDNDQALAASALGAASPAH